MILPIEKKLKKNTHRKIAMAQDILVMEIYKNFPSAIIHGGTAIWRCYNGNRFSEDVDVYLPLKSRNIDYKKFLDGLRGKGFIIEKFKKTSNALFSKFSCSGGIVRFEAVFKDIKHPVTRVFEVSDGTSMMVNTFSADELIKEKADAYLARKKIRDIYDIFHLLRFVEDDKIKSTLRALVKESVKPLDEKELKALIMTGSVPSLKEMVEVIRAWAR